MTSGADAFAMHARSASLVDSRSERPAIGEDEDENEDEDDAERTIDRLCDRVRVKPPPSMRDTVDDDDVNVIILFFQSMRHFVARTYPDAASDANTHRRTRRRR